MIHHEHCRQTIICNAYRPPKGKLKKAIEYLDNCLAHFDLAKSDVFILGEIIKISPQVLG